MGTMNPEDQALAATTAKVTGSKQALAAVAGLVTAGPIGAVASWVAIRGVRGQWGSWFLLGVPAVIAINAVQVGVLIGIGAILHRTDWPLAPQAQVPTPQPSDAAPAPPMAPAAPVATASPRLFEAGTAVGGQRVRLDLATLRQGEKANEIHFNYLLGDERITATANCAAGTWITRPDLITHRPRSGATQAMLARVCQGHATTAETAAVVEPATTAYVFDPPSNIRVTPNGAILCTVPVKQAIAVQGRQGDWMATNHCGRPGFIHVGQVRL